MTARTMEATRSSVLLNIARLREVGLGVFILGLIVIVSLRAPVFLRLDNIELILLNMSITTIVALAQSMVIMTKSIDLSVASMIGLVAMMVAAFVKVNPGVPVFVAVLLGMLLGAILGMGNGLIIAYGKVPPIIATLGTLSVYRGLVFVYSSGTYINGYQLSDAFKAVAKGTPLIVPNMILFAVVIALIVHYFLTYTRTGRSIYAVGSNREAAELSGIRTQRIIFLVFVLCGIACGFSGVLWASRYESAQTNTALGFELEVICASVVGGVSITGGVGRVPGVILGVMLLSIIENALTIVGISPFWELAAQGFLILAAVVSDSLIQRSVQRNIRA